MDAQYRAAIAGAVVAPTKLIVERAIMIFFNIVLFPTS
jgi:hypothetical protein